MPVTLSVTSSIAAAEKPLPSTAFTSVSVVTLPFATFTTAVFVSEETLTTSVTPVTLLSASCTLLVQAPHVMPVTLSVTFSIGAAEKPLPSTAFTSVSVVTLPFATFTTAVFVSEETLTTSVTPVTLLSASCTLLVQAPHVMPVTLSVTFSIGAAEKPLPSTAFTSVSVVTLPFATFTTAVFVSEETLTTSVTPVTLLSASCTLLVQAPHVMPVTLSVTSSVEAFASSALCTSSVAGALTMGSVPIQTQTSSATRKPGESL